MLATSNNCWFLDTRPNNAMSSPHHDQCMMTGTRWWFMPSSPSEQEMGRDNENSWYGFLLTFSMCWMIIYIRRTNITYTEDIYRLLSSFYQHREGRPTIGDQETTNESSIGMFCIKFFFCCTKWLITVRQYIRLSMTVHLPTLRSSVVRCVPE